MQRLFPRTPPPHPFNVRPATPADRAALTRLTERARRTHFHLDWTKLEDWLEPGDAPARSAGLLALHGKQIAGALFASTQDSPVAWIRLVAVADDHNATSVFGVLLDPTVELLRAAGAESLACLASPDWLASLLPRNGFAPVIDVTNFLKPDRAIPDYGSPQAIIRRARREDLSAAVINDRAAFGPMWWHDFHSLERVLRDAVHFIVAEIDGRVIGHAFSDLYGERGHLVRLAVHPDGQRRGIGSRLLAESLLHLMSVGAHPITLNTQADNYTSQSLYRRFGFVPTGDSTTVMLKNLAP